MWNRIDHTPGSKGFDADKPLPYRERLVVVYLHTDAAGITGETRELRGVGEAFVHDGEWYWWNTGEHPKTWVKVQSSYKIIAWTEFPHQFFGVENAGS